MNSFSSQKNTFMPRAVLNKLILWMVFFNGLMASLYSFYALTPLTEFKPTLSSLYFVLQQFGHFQFFAFVIVIPILFINLILPHKRFIQTILLIIFSLFIGLVYIDYSIFLLYKFHLNGMVWNMLTGGALTEIFVFDQDNVLSILGVLIGLILMQLLCLNLATNLATSKKISYKKRGLLTFLVILALQLSGQFIYAFASAKHNTEITVLVRYIPLPQPLSMSTFLYKNGFVNETEDENINTQASGHFKYPLNPMQCQASDNLPNIIVIGIDSLRFDMLTKKIMPNSYQLSLNSLNFSHHISTGDATRFGIFGLFSGLYGSYWFDGLNTQMKPVLITEMLKHNYQFGFFANARLSSPEFDQALFSQVKQHIPVKTPGDSVIEREYTILKQANEFVTKNKDKPFFSFIFFDAPHAYAYPEQDIKFLPTHESINYLKLNNNSTSQSFLNRYKNAVHFDDRLTGEFIETLKNNGLMDNSIIILTGDHGQEANETKTNSWGHNSNFSKYQTQVPLLIHWPNKSSKTFNHLTSHADIVPTLMQNVFNCSNPVKDYSSGQSLFNDHERDFVLSNNWTNQALVNKDFIREFHKLSGPINYDFDSYKELDTQEKYSQFDSAILKANSLFYQ